MVKISIIVPVCNSEKYLKQSISSVINQTFSDIEIICIGDSSASILESLSENPGIIRIFNQKIHSLGKARNYGINNAKGEYIAFLDVGDIFVDENSLKLLYDVANEKNADMVCGNLKNLAQDGALLDNPYDYYCFGEYSAIEPNEYGLPGAFYKNIYKRSFLDENNIRFKELIGCPEPVFAADILTNVDVIYGAPVDFYAHRVSKMPYSKLNTRTKKLHYITQYKYAFDIFDKAGLPQLSERYKAKFMQYLHHSIKSKRLDVYGLVMEVFGRNNSYFVNFQDEYDYFRVFGILNNISIENNPSYFFEAKNELNNMDVFNNGFIPKKLLENVRLLNSSNSFDEYKEKYFEFNLNHIKKEIVQSNKRNKQYIKNLNNSRKAFNDEFNRFILKFEDLPEGSKLDYYNDLKEDFLTIESQGLYNRFRENLNDFNKKFFENIIKSQSFEEFDLFFENVLLENQNRELEEKIINLIKENEEIKNDVLWQEYENLISKNTELRIINKDLKLKFYKMGNNG